jgi:hypothetical protein
MLLLLFMNNNTSSLINYLCEILRIFSYYYITIVITIIIIYKICTFIECYVPIIVLPYFIFIILQSSYIHTLSH